SITPTYLCEKFPSGPGYTGYKAYYAESVQVDKPCSSKLDEQERRCSTLFCVYPNLVASQAPERLRYMAVQPTSVGSVNLRRGTAIYEAGLHSDEIKRRVEVWNRIGAEDRVNLERLQRGFASRYAASGPLGPPDYEGTVVDFYRYLERRLG